MTQSASGTKLASIDPSKLLLSSFSLQFRFEFQFDFASLCVWMAIDTCHWQWAFAFEFAICSGNLHSSQIQANYERTNERKQRDLGLLMELYQQRHQSSSSSSSICIRRLLVASSRRMQCNFNCTRLQPETTRNNQTTSEARFWRHWCRSFN